MIRRAATGDRAINRRILDYNEVIAGRAIVEAGQWHL
jgi:hypothetical protein